MVIALTQYSLAGISHWFAALFVWNYRETGSQICLTTMMLFVCGRCENGMEFNEFEAASAAAMTIVGGLIRHTMGQMTCVWTHQVTYNNPQLPLIGHYMCTTVTRSRVEISSVHVTRYSL